MVKKDLLPIPKKSGEKPAIHCPHYFVHISHVEVAEERHGGMKIGGEIEYDLNSNNNGLHDTFARNAKKRIKK